MTRKGRRLTLIGLALGVLGVAAGLALYALRDNVVFFYGPSEVAEKAVPPGTRLRIGGLVAEGSVVKSADEKVTFAITDMKTDRPRRPIRGRCPISSVKARASSPKACSKPRASSGPIRCSPSMTRNTCPAKSPMRSRSRASGMRAMRRRPRHPA